MEGVCKSRYDEELFDEDVVEDLEDDEEETREELINSSVGKTATTHPILYDTYNLCELQAKDQISVFKVNVERHMQNILN